jgi:hypothetical protein
MNMTKSDHQRILSTYRTMATVARYRPAAPSDGFGNITVPEKELNLDREADRYAAQWWEQEKSQKFTIGVCYSDTRPALIYAIEAARELCGGENRIAAKLLKLAESELRNVKKSRKKDPANTLQRCGIL